MNEKMKEQMKELTNESMHQRFMKKSLIPRKVFFCWRKGENMAFQTAGGMSTVMNDNTPGESVKKYDI